MSYIAPHLRMIALQQANELLGDMTTAPPKEKLTTLLQTAEGILRWLVDEETCCCGEPTKLNLVHRTEGPCYHPQGSKYPHRDGQVEVLGPGVIISADGMVITSHGDNYYRQVQPEMKLALPVGWHACSPTLLKQLVPSTCDDLTQIPGRPGEDVSHYHPWEALKVSNNTYRDSKGYWKANVHNTEGIDEGQKQHNEDLGHWLAKYAQ